MAFVTPHTFAVSCNWRLQLRAPGPLRMQDTGRRPLLWKREVGGPLSELSVFCTVNLG
jgi:hypothetical protein